MLRAGLASAVRRAIAQPTVARRTMGSSGGGGAGSSEYGGFVAPHVSPVHENWGKGMMVIMWFWIFHRAREDGKAVLGLEHPWDAHGDHGHGDHGHDDHGHGDHGGEWVKPATGVMPTKE
eukprot:g7361.t1